MTQVLLVRNTHGVHLVSDSLYNGSRTFLFRKVFRMTDDVIAASLGDAFGAKILLEVAKYCQNDTKPDDPCASADITKAVRDSWSEYVRRNSEAAVVATTFVFGMRDQGALSCHLHRSTPDTGWSDRSVGQAVEVFGPASTDEGIAITQYRSAVLPQLEQTARCNVDPEIAFDHFRAAMARTVGRTADHQEDLGSVGSPTTGLLLPPSGPVVQLDRIALPLDATDAFPALMELLYA